MENYSLTEQKQTIESQLGTAEEQLHRLTKQIDGKSQELKVLIDSGQRYHLLSEICESLGKLDEMGAASLFWGEQKSASEREQQLEHVQNVIADFRQQIDDINLSRDKLEKLAQTQIEIINDLNFQLDEVLEEEERLNNDYVIEREQTEIPFHPMLMPWTIQKQDQERFYKSLGGVCAFLLLLNLLILFWDLPEFNPEDVEVPEYLVEMVRKPRPIPQPPVERPETIEEEEVVEEQQQVAESEKQPEPEPEPVEVKTAREIAETAGVLAFKDSFDDLLQDGVDERLGAAANLRNDASSAIGDSSRNLVMSQARQTSGGINNAQISRGVGGTAGSQLGNGVSFARVDSAIGTDMVADDRPLSDGIGPTRTDEEIQIVFDRYKASLYRIYNRELRNDPFLKGKMVLRITIVPDGSVSLARVESTNMDLPAFIDEVVNRVKRFNFGPKDGVPQITILYPIDFLPAA